MTTAARRCLSPRRCRLAPRECPFGAALILTTARRMQMLGGVKELGPDGTTFAQPVLLTIRLPVTALRIPGVGVATAVQWYDPAAGQWVALQSAVDLIQQTVSTNISHFSLYAAMLDKSAAPSAQPTGMRISPSLPRCLQSLMVLLVQATQPCFLRRRRRRGVRQRLRLLVHRSQRCRSLLASDRPSEAALSWAQLESCFILDSVVSTGRACTQSRWSTW